jgi:L,D-transpeptidase YcbB
MKVLSIKSNILFSVFLILLLAFSGCKNHKHKLKNGRWVAVTSTTVYIDTIQAKKYLADSASLAEFGHPISRFYADNEFFMAWDSFENKAGLADKFIKRLQNVADDGLNPADFRIDELKDLMGQVAVPATRDTAMKKLDILLTTEFLKYTAEMREGITRNRKKEFGWVVRPINIPIDSFIKLVMAARDAPDPFKVLDPPHPEYLRLREALKKYRDADKNGLIPFSAQVKKLSIGDTSESIVSLRERLAISGEYRPGATNFFNPRIFDRNLELAVKAFQTKNGIDPDGIVKGKTIDALNMGIKDRIRQILVNMERWRLVPEFANRYLMVNLPEFKLHVFDGGKEVITMRTIVGKDFKATPVFNDNLSNIVFSPYWNIPNSITEAEILPAWYKDPLYLQKHNMEAVDGFDTGAHVVPYWMVSWHNISEPDFHYRIRQRPLGDNPLGAIKFMFPNNYNVYLHGTSSPGLFNKVVRMYSHGCIRIEDPVKLAEFLLRDQPGWDRSQIEEYMTRGHEEWVKLTGTPVFILYFTTWVDADGNMQFRNDIYDLDKALAAALGI